MSDKKILCAAKAIIEKDGKFLAIKQEVNGLIFWDLPGGKMEFGETPEETLHREVMEEVGLTVEELSLLGTYHFFRQVDGDQVVCLTYRCVSTSDVIDIEHNPGLDNITEYRWLTKDEFLTGDYPVTESNTVKELIATC